MFLACKLAAAMWAACLLLLLLLTPAEAAARARNETTAGPRRVCPGGDIEACAADCPPEPPNSREQCLRVCTLLCVEVCARATTQPPPLTDDEMSSRGPISGSLVVAGGSIFSPDREIFDRFASLANVDGEVRPNACGVPLCRSRRVHLTREPRHRCT